ncbi:MAG TPA: hypothetical protein VKH37_02475, partial [Ferruginibacter sp.]|nr:hypothetical protein [Ferruginibacter sp.]
MGTIALDGQIKKGSGFTVSTLNLDFEGKVHQLMFNGYNYQNISLNGSFNQKLFTGTLSIDDPNLKIDTLNGSVNLSKDDPIFDFNARLKYANLKALHLAADNFSLSGSFNLNFTGNNIDNFLGEASLRDASLKLDSTRLSFDSLTLTSDYDSGFKRLVVRSNEIDGTLRGQFNILQLPDAFKLFLNKYYPSKIDAPAYHLSGQDFTFDIKTRVIDDYVKLFDKRLKGFNFSTFTGNIKSEQNELNVFAKIQSFEYDGKQFNDIKLESHGNSDSLLTNVTAGEIIISDSLRFPSSTLTVATHNDRSIVHLITSSSSGTLGDADLNTLVETTPDGGNIHF